MRRIHSNYRFVIGFNGALILLGALGLLTPAVSALLHNTSTLLLSLHSMTELMPPVRSAALMQPADNNDKERVMHCNEA